MEAASKEHVVKSDIILIYNHYKTFGIAPNNESTWQYDSTAYATVISAQYEYKYSFNQNWVNLPIRADGSFTSTKLISWQMIGLHQS